MWYLTSLFLFRLPLYLLRLFFFLLILPSFLMKLPLFFFGEKKNISCPDPIVALLWYLTPLFLFRLPLFLLKQPSFSARLTLFLCGVNNNEATILHVVSGLFLCIIKWLVLCRHGQNVSKLQTLLKSIKKEMLYCDCLPLSSCWGCSCFWWAFFSSWSFCWGFSVKLKPNKNRFLLPYSKHSTMYLKRSVVSLVISYIV